MLLFNDKPRHFSKDIFKDISRAKKRYGNHKKKILAIVFLRETYRKLNS